MGNGAVEGAITSILKQWKVYYSKMHLNFFLFLQMPRYSLGGEHNQVDPTGGQKPQSIKSPLSLCDYMRV